MPAAACRPRQCVPQRFARGSLVVVLLALQRGLYVSTNHTQYGYGGVYGMTFDEGTLYYQTSGDEGAAPR